MAQCTIKIDLGFALDASGSIGNVTFYDVRKFTTNILKKVDFSKTKTHAGVIVYSTEPKLVIKLNQFYDLNKFSNYLTDETPWPADYNPYNGWMNG